MSLRRARAWHGSLLLAALLTSGRALALCGDGVWEEGEPCDDGNDVANDSCSECRLSCETLSGGLVSHTCGHGAHGPFEQGAAQSYPGFIYTDISSPHTYFTLTLAGEPGQNRSAVQYWPTSSSLFAFFLKENYPFSVRSSAGTEAPILFEHAVSCGGPGASALTWVKVYDLTDENPYDLVFGPTPGSSVSVAVEYMGPASPVFWDRDGDGFGGALAGLGSCEHVDPNGFSPVDIAGDCDDSDAETYPGALERCDGTDNDCSGDEDVGADALCDEHEEGSACVETNGATHCGCTSDRQCDGLATCHAVDQRCAVAGGGGEAGTGQGGRGDAGETSTMAGAAGEPTGEGGVSGTGAGGGGGTGAAAPSAGEPSLTETNPGPASNEGCGCRTVKGPLSSGPGWLMAALLVGVARRRRA